MVQDIFDQKVLCSKCDKPMEKKRLEKNGFMIRALVCGKCNERLIHPVDEQEYHKFKDLRNKEFKVKMRLVGNSYAVSIPKEIVLFMNAIDKEVNQHRRMMDDMVKLCFEDFGRLSLNFGQEKIKELEK